MSPLLFDLAVVALAVIMEKAKNEGIVKRVLSTQNNMGVNMLQYADNTIFLLKDDIESAKNLKFILYAFEQMSGLTINCHKRELFLFEEANNKRGEYIEFFTCGMGVLPMKYLGTPMSDSRIRNMHWSGLIEKR